MRSKNVYRAQLNCFELGKKMMDSSWIDSIYLVKYFKFLKFLNMSLRLLTLDATGTIFRFCRSPIEEYVSVASNYGFKLDPNRVQKQVQAPVIHNLQVPLFLSHFEVHNVAMNVNFSYKLQPLWLQHKNECKLQTTANVIWELSLTFNTLF